MTADELSRARDKLGLTQAGLADRLGIARKTINEYENGKAKISRQTELAIQALLLQHHFGDLLQVLGSILPLVKGQ